VTVTALDETPLNVPRTAQFTATRTGPTITFDASASTDADGTIVEYLWDFGDGELATGAAVTHTFEPGASEVALVATDGAGGKGFTTNAEDVLVVGGEPRRATAYSAPSLTLTNAFTVAGDTSGVLVDGDFTCNSRGSVAGDVTVTGDASGPCPAGRLGLLLVEARF